MILMCTLPVPRQPPGLLSQERFNHPTPCGRCTVTHLQSIHSLAVLPFSSSLPASLLPPSSPPQPGPLSTDSSYTLAPLCPRLSDPQLLLDSLGKREEFSLPPELSLVPLQGPTMAIEVPLHAVRVQRKGGLAPGPAEEACSFFMLMFFPLAAQMSKALSAPLEGGGKNETPNKMDQPVD